MQLVTSPTSCNVSACNGNPEAQRGAGHQASTCAPACKASVTLGATEFRFTVDGGVYTEVYRVRVVELTLRIAEFKRRVKEFTLMVKEFTPRAESVDVLLLWRIRLD